MQDKQLVRKQLMHQRNALGHNNLADLHANIANFLISTASQDEYIAAYYAIKSEPDILPALTSYKTCLPCVCEDNQLIFREYKNHCALSANKFGIPEPLESAVEINSISVFFVPCVAVDLNFYRLGYGGGYYDRLIARYRGLPNCSSIFIGISYHQFLLDSLPTEPKDMQLDGIITEKGIILRDKNSGIG